MSDISELAALREQIEQQERRIVELEVEAAFRRKAADDLDDVVREQGQQLMLLERRVTELLGQLSAATHEGEVD
ncbi:MAG: SlyX family protein [Enhygromyxa sp.]